MPSISAEGYFSYEPYSYECFSYDRFGSGDSFEYGRFIMNGTVVVTNYSNQGCALSSELYFPIGAGNWGTPVIDPNLHDYEDIYFIGGNPFDKVILNGKESKAIECKLYIYVDFESHTTITNYFGNDFSDVSIDKITKYLYYGKSQIITYAPPITGQPIHKTNIPLKDGYLTLILKSNTGANCSIFIDYASKDWFEFLENT